MIKKIFSLLVLLFVAATGAWATDYYVVGTMNDWGASKQFQLTQNPNNEAEYMITLNLKVGAEFKVIGVGENTTWYPGDGKGNYYVNTAGKYTVYFRPNYDGGDDWHEHCIYAAAAPAPAIPLTDLGNNSWEFTMPANAVVAKIEYDTELELQEENVNTTVLADWDGYEADVTLTRTLTGGMWNTLALPFSISSSNVTLLQTFLATQSASIDFMELKTSSYANGTLTLDFGDAAEIKAGHPYLVKTSANVNFATLPAIIDAAIATYSLPYGNPFKNVEISSAIVPTVTSVVDFIPTLGKTTVGNTGDNPNSILFLATGNTLLNPNTMPTYMKGFRAYFQLKGDAVGARSFAMNIDGETTAVSELKNNEQIINNNGYDLQGRRMEGQPTKKGVYIVNGKKVVIK
jgi:hypothetical protein